MSGFLFSLYSVPSQTVTSNSWPDFTWPWVEGKEAQPNHHGCIFSPFLGVFRYVLQSIMNWRQWLLSSLQNRICWSIILKLIFKDKLEKHLISHEVHFYNLMTLFNAQPRQLAIVFKIIWKVHFVFDTYNILYLCFGGVIKAKVFLPRSTLTFLWPCLAFVCSRRPNWFRLDTKYFANWILHFPFDTHIP